MSRAVAGWPPPPRDRVYAPRERARLLAELPLQPEWTAIADRVRTWLARAEEDWRRAEAERVLASALAAGDAARAAIEARWSGPRRRTWLRSRFRSALESERGRVEEAIAVLDSAGARSASAVDVARALGPDAAVRLLAGAGVRVNAGDVRDLVAGRRAVEDLVAATERAERAERDRAAIAPAHAAAAWRLIAQASERARTVEDLRRELPRSARVTLLPEAEGWRVRVAIAGSTYTGPRAPPWAAVERLHAYAARRLAGDVDHLAALRVADHAEGHMREDTHPGIGVLAAIARAGGASRAEAWLLANELDVGAWLWGAAGVASGAHGLRVLPLVGSRTSPGGGGVTRREEMDGDVDLLVDLIDGEYSRQDPHEEPPVVVRTAHGRLAVVAGAGTLQRLQRAGVGTTRVRVEYQSDPARELVSVGGRFEPFAPGRAVTFVDGGARAYGHVVRRVHAGGLSPGGYDVELDNGRVIFAHASQLRLRAAPSRPVTRPNPPRLAELADAVALDRVGRWLAVHGHLDAGTPVVARANPDGQVSIRRTGATRAFRRAGSVLLRGAASDAGLASGDLLRLNGAQPSGAWRQAWRVGPLVAAEDRGQGLVYIAPDARAQSPRANRVPVSAEVLDPLYDAEGRRHRVAYEVVEAADDGTTLVPSHTPADLTRWSEGYPRDFQARDLGSVEETTKIRTIAAKLDPDRLLHPNLDATLGPPVVWEGPGGRLYALGGNGRVLGLLLAPPERIAAYNAAGRALWPCWPTRAPRPGHRWVLVRVVRDATHEEAARLAAASQASTAAEETRMGRALSLARSIQLDPEALPPVRWLVPISADTVVDFARANQAFASFVLDRLDPARRAVYLNDADRLAPLLEAALLGTLPPDVQRPGLLTDPRLEDALLGALPGLVTIRSQAADHEIYADFDLLSALPRSLDLFASLRRRKVALSRWAAELAGEARTERLADVERQADAPPLSLALAAALYNASRRAAPGLVMADYVRAYDEEARRHDPRQASLWATSHPDPARVLADLVGITLPERSNPPARVALLFGYERFAHASAARDWLKQRGVHAGVPNRTDAGWRIGPDVRASRRFSLGRGVHALVE